MDTCSEDCGQCDPIDPCCGEDGMYLETGTVCRMNAGDCDLIEACDGISSDCPLDDVFPSGTVCAEDANSEEMCNPDQADAYCGQDVALYYQDRVCNGSSTACPADNYGSWEFGYTTEDCSEYMQTCDSDTLTCVSTCGDGDCNCGENMDTTVCPQDCNHPPVAVDDGPYSCIEGGTLFISTPGDLGDGVLANDTDQDGDMLEAHLGVVTPDYGSLELNVDGAHGVFTYQHDGTGTVDHFTYKAYDGELYSKSEATVVIVFIPTNFPPLAEDLFMTPVEKCNENVNIPALNVSFIFEDRDSEDGSPDDGEDILSEARIKIYEDSFYSNEVAEWTLSGNGVRSGESFSQTFSHPELDFETSYYWKLQVVDAGTSGESDWIEGGGFETGKCLPLANFNWNPDMPIIGEEVTLDAERLSGGCPMQGPEDFLNFEWLDFNDVDGVYTYADGVSYIIESYSAHGIPHISGTPVNADPIITVKFLEKIGEGNDVRLEVTNQNGTCPCEKQVPLRFSLPEWEEVKPE